MYYMQRVKIKDIDVADLPNCRRCAYATSDKYGVWISPIQNFAGRFYVVGYQFAVESRRVLFELNYADIDYDSDKRIGEIVNLNYETLHPLVAGTEYEDRFVEKYGRVFFEHRACVERSEGISSDMICKSELGKFLDKHGVDLYLCLRFKDRVMNFADARELRKHLENVRRFLYENNHSYGSIDSKIENSRNAIEKARKKIEENYAMRRDVEETFRRNVETLARHGIEFNLDRETEEKMTHGSEFREEVSCEPERA